MRQQGRSLSQVELEEMIENDLAMLEETVDSYAVRLEAAARNEVTYKRKRARMFQSASGSVRDKESFADVECSEEQEEYLLSEALVKATREKIHMLHARLDQRRSLNANLRSFQ